MTKATVNGTRGVYSDFSLVHDVQLFQSVTDTYMSIEAEWPVMVVSSIGRCELRYALLCSLFMYAYSSTCFCTHLPAGVSVCHCVSSCEIAFV